MLRRQDAVQLFHQFEKVPAVLFFCNERTQFVNAITVVPIHNL